MEALVLAAGQGKRLEPLTETQPKVMLPLAGKPLLEHLLLEVKKAGIGRVTLLVGYLGRDIKDYFGDGSPLGMEIEYLEQEKRLGTAHAIAQSSFSGDFMVLNGDTLISSQDIRRVAKAHTGGATIAVARSERPELYGVVEVEEGVVKRVEEKPEKPRSSLIACGIYAFSPRIYQEVEKIKPSSRGEYELTDATRRLVDMGKVRAVEVEDFTDIGTPWGYLDANAGVVDKAGEEMEGEVEEGAVVKGKLVLKEGAKIKAGTYIEGPVYIGENSTVGPNSYLRSFTTLGKGCTVGQGVEIKNSIVMDGSKLPHLSYLGDSIVGRNCNFGAGTKVGNLRLDESNVKVYLKGRLVDTGRRKFGAVVGDNVKLGLNAMLNSGRKVGSSAKVGPGVVVYRDIPRGKTLTARQDLEYK